MPATVQIGWKFKEFRSCLDDIDEFVKVMDALIAAKVDGAINCFFEFESAQQGIYFGQAVKMIPYIKDFAEFENRKEELKQEITKLTEERDKVAEEARKPVTVIKQALRCGLCNFTSETYAAFASHMGEHANTIGSC